MAMAQRGEKVAFAFIEWPSRSVCEAAVHDIMSQRPLPFPVPFDQARMIAGGFCPIVVAAR
ncbi:hypothetical protein SFOMI_2304 [Sphingobium fuliginis]|uniref:Uncharacterized protein n=2 Tax=Sphingobium fuliginis (strain ATCC 27551) TaxID=336203 RepID=A0A292ZFS5_SPHSA|nr:hypothetical protein SFOMI_2304 [Sphingobium fuliginis]